MSVDVCCNLGESSGDVGVANVGIFWDHKLLAVFVEDRKLLLCGVLGIDCCIVCEGECLVIHCD